MPMRHPLRNEFEKIARDLEPLKVRMGYEGAMARAMLKLMPVFVEILEDERDRQTKPGDKIDGLRCAITNMIAHSIKLNVTDAQQREALRQYLHLLEKEIAPRLARNTPKFDKVFMPESRQ